MLSKRNQKITIANLTDYNSPSVVADCVSMYCLVSGCVCASCIFSWLGGRVGRGALTGRGAFRDAIGGFVGVGANTEVGGGGCEVEVLGGW